MDTDNKMLVKLGSMVDPRTFWATELPNDSTLAPNGKHSKILKAEDNLSKNISHDFSNSDRFINGSTCCGTLVAVRKSCLSTLWFRGRLEQIYQIENQLLAKIFLIDYGEVLDRTDVASCVRKLPAFSAIEKPLALQIVLRALAPVTQDLDFQLGNNKMGTVIAKSFDFAAVSLMSGLFNSSTKCGELRDYVRDCQGRLHGQLYIKKDEEMVHLNQVLIEANFAEESEEKLQKDLSEPAPLPVSSKKERDQLSESEDDLDLTSASRPDLKWFEKVDMNSASKPDMSTPKIADSVEKLSDSSGLGRGQRLQKCPEANVGVGTIPKTKGPTSRLAYLKKLVGNNKSKNISSKSTTDTPAPETKQQEMVRKMREQLKIKYSEEDEYSLWNDLKKDDLKKDSLWNDLKKDLSRFQEESGQASFTRLSFRTFLKTRDQGPELDKLWLSLSAPKAATLLLKMFPLGRGWDSIWRSR